jgi:hypothetical protein
VLVHIRRSKTDQEGEGAQIPIPGETSYTDLPPSPWSPRRYSLGDDRGLAPDSNMTGRKLPYRFVHEVKRAHRVFCYSDHGAPLL